MSEIVPTELETVPEVESRFHQSVSVVVGLVAVLASLLAILEADAHRRNDIAGSRATRLSTQIFAETAASSPYFSFRVSTLQDATGLALQGTARTIAAFSRPGIQGVEASRAAAEHAAAKRATAIAHEMGKLPTEKDGVDEATRVAVASTPARLRQIVRRQNEAVDAAERYARRETRAILGLSLSATAAALLGLAGLLGSSRPGRLLLLIALLAMLGAIASGATALAS